MHHTTRKTSSLWIIASCIALGFILQFLVAMDSAYAGCSILLIGKNRSTDGSVLVAHNEDAADKSARLTYISRKHHPEKKVHLNYITIPQVPETLAYWAMGYSKAVAKDPEFDNEWILNGMNEAGVSITSAIVFTREKAPAAKQGITRFAIRQLVLERATSARAAVDLITKLITKYGLALAPDDPDQAIVFGVADSKKAWLIECSFRHWVAKIIDDNSYSASGNSYTIDTDWNLASPDLVNYAIKQGWYKPKQGPFSFKKAYESLTPTLHPAHSASRVWQAQVMLDELKTGKVDVPFLWSIISQPPVQSFATQAFMIWHLRDNLPKELGSLMWYGLSNATTSVMVPIYMGSTKVPAPYMDSPKEYDTFSAYWRFRLIGTALYPQRWIYVPPYKKVRQQLDHHQLGIKLRNMHVEQLAPIYYKLGGTKALKRLLTTHTYDELQRALNTATKIAKKYQFKFSPTQDADAW
jgi:dipeptidase